MFLTICSNSQQYHQKAETLLTEIKIIPDTSPLHLDLQFPNLPQTLAGSDSTEAHYAFLVDSGAMDGATIDETFRGKPCLDATQKSQSRLKPQHMEDFFSVKRAPVQCDGRQKWGHKVSSCFFLAQLAWSLKYMKKYPKYCEDLATAYRDHNCTVTKQATIRHLQVHGIMPVCVPG